MAERAYKSIHNTEEGAKAARRETDGAEGEKANNYHIVAYVCIANGCGKLLFPRTVTTRCAKCS